MKMEFRKQIIFHLMLLVYEHNSSEKYHRKLIRLYVFTNDIDFNMVHL